MMLTANTLRELVHYEPITGIFRWSKARRGVRSGAETGCINPQGYLVIGICSRVHLAHRLAWLYMTGSWPEQTVDHRNGVRNDNRWINLREATYGQNNTNTGIRTVNTSGVTGVSFIPTRNRWRAYINFDGKRRELGKYSTKESAMAARAAAERDHFGEFRHQAAH